MPLSISVSFLSMHVLTFWLFSLLSEVLSTFCNTAPYLPLWLPQRTWHSLYIFSISLLLSATEICNLLTVLNESPTLRILLSSMFKNYFVFKTLNTKKLQVFLVQFILYNLQCLVLLSQGRHNSLLCCFQTTTYICSIK